MASRVLVYGGKGALGSAVVSYFKGKNWVRAECVCVCVQKKIKFILDLTIIFSQWVGSIDLFANEEADANVLITETDHWTKQSEEVNWF